jgi:hypothetical protein
VQHWHFDPGKNALILDARRQLSAPLTSTDRRIFQNQMDDLLRASPSEDADAEEHQWTSLKATAKPALDASSGLILHVSDGSDFTSVGIARSNILDVPASSGFAAGLVKARLREELKSAAFRKTARADVESDLALLQQLLALQPDRLASTTDSAESAPPAALGKQ